MGLDVEALSESFEVIVEREPLVAARFYPILFARYPEVRPLFGRFSDEEQQRMLTEMLVAVVDHVEDGDWLETELKALGERHATYGVRPEMFPMVGECLLATFEEVAGDRWEPRFEQAWVEAYGAITALTLTGYPEDAR